jgi:hypothetical protein
MKQFFAAMLLWLVACAPPPQITESGRSCSKPQASLQGTVYGFAVLDSGAHMDEGKPAFLLLRCRWTTYLGGWGDGVSVPLTQVDTLLAPRILRYVHDTHGNYRFVVYTPLGEEK